jgi:threonine dehydratase
MTMHIDVLAQAHASRQAAQRIAPYIKPTPVARHRALSQHCQADVWIKQEYLQHTGSFKLRGALNAVLSLTPAQRRNGVVAVRLAITAPPWPIALKSPAAGRRFLCPSKLRPSK